MRHISEYRDASRMGPLLDAISASVARPINLMEVCGGQTHNLLKYGIDAMLPEQLTMLHGPGCPVCVTPLELIDQAIAIAKIEDVIVTSFGDMLRVPGSHTDLLGARSEGADVRIVYSPLDAADLAEKHRDRQIVFVGVGFETTAPIDALAVLRARQKDLDNFSLLAAHVLVPPAIDALLCAGDVNIHGFLAPGHVCAVMGYTEYEALAERHGVPIVVTGFEPLDLLVGIHMAVRAIQTGQATVFNQYRRVVTREGNVPAQQTMRRVFALCDRKWRGLGLIPNSGLRLRSELSRFDAAARFGVAGLTARESTECRAGEVLRGALQPPQCVAFARECNPDHPLGAPMVSAEGACAAYYNHRRT